MLCSGNVIPRNVIVYLETNNSNTFKYVAAAYGETKNNGMSCWQHDRGFGRANMQG